jgi:hypothetical protein
MKTSNRNNSKLTAIAVLLAGLMLPGIAANAPLPPQPGASTSFGKTYDQWEDTYLRWTFGALTVPTDANGNAAVGGVVLLPFLFPAADGSPQSADITMSAGEAFMMTLYGFVGFSYADGTPSDQFLDLSLYQTLDIKLTLDGVTLINGGNAFQYFSQILFDPPIPGDGYSIIWFQGIGLVHTPLTSGKHTLKLDAKNTIPVPPNFGSPIFELHNTWNVTVQAVR